MSSARKSQIARKGTLFFEKEIPRGKEGLSCTLALTSIILTQRVTLSRFPDNDYFRSEKVQEQMGDILFIYCKINHDVSYRQGMHELVAHMLWVVSSESLDTSSELESST